MAVLLFVRWCYARLRGREGLGFGDIKLGAGIGAWLPLDAIPICFGLAASGALSHLSIFGDDYGLNCLATREALRAQGIANVPKNDTDDVECTRHALYATQRIVELVDQFATQNKRRWRPRGVR